MAKKFIILVFSILVFASCDWAMHSLDAALEETIGGIIYLLSPWILLILLFLRFKDSKFKLLNT